MAASLTLEQFLDIDPLTDKRQLDFDDITSESNTEDSDFDVQSDYMGSDQKPERHLEGDGLTSTSEDSIMDQYDATVSWRTLPQYIVKFSNLPADFTPADLKLLFQSNFINFVKFKIFWELQKFNKKVVFVELFSFRDLNKIMKFWSNIEYLKYFHIILEMSNFIEFEKYFERKKVSTNTKINHKLQFELDRWKPKQMKPQQQEYPPSISSTTNNIRDEFNSSIKMLNFLQIIHDYEHDYIHTSIGNNNNNNGNDSHSDITQKETSSLEEETNIDGLFKFDIPSYYYINR
ncbi:RNA recognition motif domain-containing protein NDAI_0H01720 [Naumovozyma dairenensis CBS 421]|uniref:RRM domain-containing protein n=1 Tax=Naumovozyma dairenensis (strain ATCC 10597 / BCRC 20456 / CBS 421 / NBRC 0211 / NRRL Y-12639) TaxID=1071378 RepID=G0WEY5_NAUDC|nr:hypothetical protein NDAI_0H01720 [Naumovozyma dairenensis CBS 421]CCD26346.1 hypothetical protein NDAI_0H01720 [Naumovozyma dairenensis CBS 421]